MHLQEKTIDSRTFREVMGRFTTGVTVVTVRDEEKPHGMTVNSFTSVSLDPLLILVCLDKGATTTDMLLRTRRFSVNILTAEQKRLAQRFAESGNEQDRFNGIDYSLSEEGTPILSGVLGHLTCTVDKVVESGDHYIFIGEVVDLGSGDDKMTPLLFYRGNYNVLAE